MSAFDKPIDRIVFGDNQFFGINHMSQDKAQERAERFAKLESVMAVYDHAIDAGIDAIMLNSNDRAKGICDAFRANPAKYGHLKWYPSIPYPHKYAAMVNDKGMVGAVQEILFAKGAKSALGKMVRGAGAVADARRGQADEDADRRGNGDLRWPRCALRVFAEHHHRSDAGL